MLTMANFATATRIGMALLGGILGFASKAQAEFVVTIEQVGSNVVATGTGTLSTAGLTMGSAQILSPDAGVEANVGGFFPYGSSTSFDYYMPVSGPTEFGYGGNFPASSFTGYGPAIVGFGRYIVVPPPDMIDGSYSSTTTWDNTTTILLSLEGGTYEWSWGSGATADDYRLVINGPPLPPNPAPEPAPLAIVAAGVLALALLRRRADV